MSADARPASGASDGLDRVDGLHVRRAGRARPGARPLVLLHGWSCHGGFFAPQLAALGARTRVLAPDLPGHGESREAGPRSIEAAADALAGLLAAEELAEVVLVGWSMGALVAWSLIERHGAERLAALVVEDMSPRVLAGGDWPHGALSGLDARRNATFLRALVPQWPRLAGPTARRCLAPDADPALAGWMEREIRAACPRALADMWASLTAQDFRALVPRLSLPVVLAHGLHSQLYGPGAALWQQARLARGRRVAFARSGHAPHLEESEKFCGLLEDLVEKPV